MKRERKGGREGWKRSGRDGRGQGEIETQPVADIHSAVDVVVVLCQC